MADKEKEKIISVPIETIKKHRDKVTKEILSGGADTTSPPMTMDDISTWEYITGEAVQFDDLPKGFFSTNILQNRNKNVISDETIGSITTGYGLDLGEKDVKSIMEKNIPNIEFKKDQFDNIIGIVPDAFKDGSSYEFYLNPAGVNTTDVVRGIGQGIQYALPLKWAHTANQAAKYGLADHAWDFTKWLLKGSTSYVGVGAVQDYGLQAAGADKKGGVLGTPVDMEKAIFNAIMHPASAAILAGGKYLINKTLTTAGGLYKKYFPTYTNRDGTPSAVAIEELSKKGFKPVTELVGTTSRKGFKDKDGIFYATDDDLIKNITSNLENGLDINPAILMARGDKYGIPLLLQQADKGTAESANKLAMVLQGGYGLEAQQIAQSLIRYQEEQSIKALAQTLGVKDTSSFMKHYDELKDGTSSKLNVSEIAGENLKNQIKNTAEIAKKNVDSRYSTLDAVSLKIKGNTFSKVLDDVDSKIMSSFRFRNSLDSPSGQAELKEMAPELFNFRKLMQNHISYMQSNDGRRVTNLTFKQLRDVNKQLFEIMDNTKEYKGLAQDLYFNFRRSMDDTILGVMKSGRTDPAIIKEFKKITKDYKFFANSFGRKNPKSLGIPTLKEGKWQNNEFVAQMLEGKLTHLDVGNIMNFTRKHRGQEFIIDDIINMENVIKKIVHDPREQKLAIASLRDNLLQSYHYKIVYDSVSKAGRTGGGTVRLDPKVLGNIISEIESKAGKKFFDFLHGQNSKGVLSDLKNLHKNLLSQESVFNRVGGNPSGTAAGTQELNKSFIGNLLQYGAYSKGQLAGLYGYKSIIAASDNSQGIISKQIGKSLETNPKRTIGDLNKEFVTIGDFKTGMGKFTPYVIPQTMEEFGVDTRSIRTVTSSPIDNLEEIDEKTLKLIKDKNKELKIEAIK